MGFDDLVKITRPVSIFYLSLSSTDLNFFRAIDVVPSSNQMVGEIDNEELGAYLSNYYRMTGYKATKEDMARELCSLQTKASNILNPSRCLWRPEDIRFDYDEFWPQTLATTRPEDEVNLVFPSQKYSDLLSEKSKIYEVIFNPINTNYLGVQKEQAEKRLKELIAQLEAGFKLKGVRGKVISMRNEEERPGEPEVHYTEYYYTLGDGIEMWLQRVATSLWVEANHKVNWSLRGYDKQTLVILFSPTNYLAIKDGAGGRSVTFSRENGGDLIDNDPFQNFLFGRQFIRKTQKETLFEFTRWARTLKHAGGITNATTEDILAGKTTPGCGWKVGLFNGILTSLNIPAQAVLINLGSPKHSGVVFPTIENLTLIHGDDPYGLKNSDPEDIFSNISTIEKALQADGSYSLTPQGNKSREDSRKALQVLHRPDFVVDNLCGAIAVGKLAERKRSDRNSLIASGLMYVEALIQYDKMVDAFEKGSANICPFFKRE